MYLHLNIFVLFGHSMTSDKTSPGHMYGRLQTTNEETCIISTEKRHLGLRQGKIWVKVQAASLACSHWQPVLSQGLK